VSYTRELPTAIKNCFSNCPSLHLQRICSKILLNVEMLCTASSTGPTRVKASDSRSGSAASGIVFLLRQPVRRPTGTADRVRIGGFGQDPSATGTPPSLSEIAMSREYATRARQFCGWPESLTASLLAPLAPWGREDGGRWGMLKRQHEIAREPRPITRRTLREASVAPIATSLVSACASGPRRGQYRCLRGALRRCR
jgi:hypothetical protein